MERHKSKGELIVEMLCDGIPQTFIREELGLTQHQFDERWKRLMYDALLPLDRRTYRARKAEILENVAKWRAYIDECEMRRQEYLSSLHQFDL